jgi:transcriptional regulator with XRE-family HTH domain
MLSMTNREAPGLNELLVGPGGRIRHLRQQRGWSQDDLAYRAREAGLSWNRSAIAAIEVGRRDIALEEFFVLPAIFEQPMHLILGGARRRVRAGTRTVTAGDLRELLTDPKTARAIRRQIMVEAGDWLTPTEAEVNVAKVLDIDVRDLPALCFDVWGRSLYQERDARVEAPGSGELAQRRGHITRQLINELRSHLNETRRRKR